MRWAVTLYGVGEAVGARAIEDDWPLAEGETFTVAAEAYRPGMVLADDGVSLAEPPPVVERRLVPKSVVVARLIAANKIDAAFQALMSNPGAFARWHAPDRPAVYADDPDAIALLQAIGADPAVVMAE